MTPTEIVLGYIAVFFGGFTTALVIVAACWWRDQERNPTPPRVLLPGDAHEWR